MTIHLLTPKLVVPYFFTETEDGAVTFTPDGFKYYQKMFNKAGLAFPPENMAEFKSGLWALADLLLIEALEDVPDWKPQSISSTV